MEHLDKLAMGIGYGLMILGALCAVAGMAGVACSYLWRKMLRDLPNIYYIHHAVEMYKKQYPPSRWAREQMGMSDDAQPSGENRA